MSDLKGLSVEGLQWLRGARTRMCEYVREQIRGDIEMLKGIGHDPDPLEALLEESDDTLLKTLLSLDQEEP